MYLHSGSVPQSFVFQRSADFFLFIYIVSYSYIFLGLLCFNIPYVYYAYMEKCLQGGPTQQRQRTKAALLDWLDMRNRDHIRSLHTNIGLQFLNLLPCELPYIRYLTLPYIYISLSSSLLCAQLRKRNLNCCLSRGTNIRLRLPALHFPRSSVSQH